MTGDDGLIWLQTGIGVALAWGGLGPGLKLGLDCVKNHREEHSYAMALCWCCPDIDQLARC